MWGRILRNSRAIAQSWGHWRWSGAIKRWLIRAHKTRSKTITCTRQIHRCDSQQLCRGRVWIDAVSRSLVHGRLFTAGIQRAGVNWCCLAVCVQQVGRLFTACSQRVWKCVLGKDKVNPYWYSGLCTMWTIWDSNNHRCQYRRGGSWRLECRVRVKGALQLLSTRYR